VNLRLALVVVVALFAIVQPGYANELPGPDETTVLLTYGSLAASVVNILCMTIGDGSTPVGILGIGLGTGLISWSLITDSLDYEDRSGFVGLGIATAVIGAADIVRARKHDAELLGMQVDPSVRRFDGEQWYGVQLSSTW
jgi:hypothetical protein